MQFAGLDVHKKSTQAAVLDEQGNKLIEERFASTVPELERFIEENLKDEFKIVMEASAVWQHLYEYLEDGGYEVRLAHPK